MTDPFNKPKGKSSAMIWLIISQTIGVIFFCVLLLAARLQSNCDGDTTDIIKAAFDHGMALFISAFGWVLFFFKHYYWAILISFLPFISAIIILVVFVMNFSTHALN